MNRKSKSFILALYLFLNSCLCGCSKNTFNKSKKIENITKNISSEIQEIIENIFLIETEPIQIEETLPLETEEQFTETKPTIEVEPTIETEPIETEPIETEPIETFPPKTLDEIALEVIGNKYGFGDERINAVIAQGFDYYEVEKRVNEILAGSPYSVPDKNTYKYNFAYTFKKIPVYDSNGNIEGSLSPYQKVIIFDENSEYYYVSFNTQSFYVNKNDVKLLADSFIELDISEQKLYMYFDGEKILEANVVTGHPNKGTTLGTNLGVTQVYAKSYDVSFEGGKKSKYFILFNWDAEGFHDANWRSDWEFEDKERYLHAGSNGCCNMKEEDVMIVDEYSYIGMPVLVHK